MSETRLVMRAVRGRVETTTAAPRFACPSHTPEDQAERDQNAAAITRVWGAKVAELMDLRNARCSDLRRWGDAARAEEAKVAALRAAVKAPPRAEAPVERTPDPDTLASLPPRVKAAAERFARDVEAVEELGPIGKMAAKISFANLRTESARADMESGAAQERADEAAFQSAKEELSSPFGFVRQLAAGRIRQLARKGGDVRAALLAKIRGSRVSQYFPAGDLEQHATIRTLEQLAEAADNPTPEGITIGVAREQIQRAKADAAKRRK